MLVKVCGISSLSNYLQIENLKVDWIGLNFYGESKRYVGVNILPEDLVGCTTKRVGVFVNQPIDIVKDTIAEYELFAVQLHGDETAEYCSRLKSFTTVVKAFGVDEKFDFSITEMYDVDFFLFDTRTSSYGGSGRKFDWSSLEEYAGKTPFLLSGGLGPDDVKEIKILTHTSFCGIDVNSKFEIEPGYKDWILLDEFITKINE